MKDALSEGKTLSGLSPVLYNTTFSPMFAGGNVNFCSSSVIFSLMSYTHIPVMVLLLFLVKNTSFPLGKVIIFGMVVPCFLAHSLYIHRGSGSCSLTILKYPYVTVLNLYCNNRLIYIAYLM